MLKTRSKSGMASLRYTMLAVSCTILWLIGITQADTINTITGTETTYWNINTTYQNNQNIDVIVDQKLKPTTAWQYPMYYLWYKNWYTHNYRWRNTNQEIIFISWRKIITTTWRCILNEEQIRPDITTELPNCTLTTQEISTQIKNIKSFSVLDSYSIYNWTQPVVCFQWNWKTYCRVWHSKWDTAEAAELISLCWTSAWCYNPEQIQYLFWESPINWWWEETPQPTWYDPETWLPCATIDTLIKYETNFNTGMCYSSTYIYSWWQIETITPKTFTELRTWYNQFRNDLNKYRNYCTPPATSTACANAFQNEDEKRSLINNIPEERLTDWWKTLYDYCHMYLTYSGDTNICDIPDEEIRSATYEDLINRLNEITVTQPWSWSVYDNYKNENNRDILTAIPSVYSKITWIFRNNTGVQGIIPWYITRIIVITVLFVLFKK